MKIYTNKDIAGETYFTIWNVTRLATMEATRHVTYDVTSDAIDNATMDAIDDVIDNATNDSIYYFLYNI